MTDRLDRLISVAELAEHLAVNRSFVYRGVESGEIPCIRVGGKLLRFDLRAVLEAYENSGGDR